MTVMRAQIKNCTWVVLAVDCIFEVQKVDEQWDAAKPSIDRPVLEICYLLGLADPGRSCLASDFVVLVLDGCLNCGDVAR
jgi:hypothetical protein